MREITIGTAHTSTLKVGEGDTAVALGSGDLRVLGTPAMAALMENAALSAIAPLLDETESSVGISLNITHDRATGIGDSVSATAVVTAVEGRRIDFEISASDSSGTRIGGGTHARFVVNVEKFMSKIGK